jgi:hypothetical protein
MKVFGDGVAQWAADTAACHTADALRRVIDNVTAAGGDELFLVPTTTDPDELTRTRDALGI